MKRRKELVISGADLTDNTFTGEMRGKFYTWNVTRAWNDCVAGKHGTPFLFDVEPAYQGNKNVEVEEDKVQRFMAMPEVLVIPGISVIWNGAAWMIEGHHRLRALYRIGAPSFLSYVVEEERKRDYLVRFDGRDETPADLGTMIGKGVSP